MPPIFIPIAMSLLAWAIAAKVLLDGKIEWRFDWMPTVTRTDQPKAFWRSVIFLIALGVFIIAVAYLLRGVPPKYHR